MKRLVFAFFFVVALGWSGALRADDNVRAVQSRLKHDGFYLGDPSGVYDSETAAAVTRYQIRHGLPITGQLDAETAGALGVEPAAKGASKPSEVTGTWKRLRNGDMQFLRDLNAGKIPPPKASSSGPAASPAGLGKAVRRKPEIKPHGTPPTPADEYPPAAPAPVAEAPATAFGKERMRDYVGAFVLAGLDPQVGAELEFFADRVDYFGEQKVERSRIRRDLLRYDAEWPQRRFWLAGEPAVKPAGQGKTRVTFPLRYELRNGSKHRSGKVLKTLTLRRSGRDDFEIVAVNERKAAGR